MSVRKRDRSGVAVIIVLGMLALLMMMGVAFSVSMRVERRSAGNYSHSVGTKNLVWAGLARAMERIEDEMDGGDYYPLFDTIGSDYSANDPAYVKLGRGEALDYIPGVLTNGAKDFMSGWSTFKVGWGHGLKAVTNYPGRYAYLILNCSDFIDANYAGGTNRVGGASSAELQLDDVMAGEDPDDLFEARDNDIRYETLQEMTSLIGSYINNSFSNDNFTVFSRYPVDEKLVSLAGSSFDLVARKNEIVRAIGKAVPDGNKEFIYYGLLDYIDSDSVPHELDKPYVERVPMINEFRVVRLSAERDNTGVTLSRWQFDVELSFPFVEISSEDFDLELDIVANVEDDAGDPLPGFTETTSKCKDVITIAEATSYADVNFRRDGVPDFPTFIDETNTAKGLTLVLEMKARVVITSDDDKLVDAVPFPEERGGIKFNIPIPTNAYPSTEIGSSQLSWECIDSRFNWDVRRGWASTNETMGHINASTLQFFKDNPREKGFDTGVPIQMRVSNTGLVSVCELGNLLLNTRHRNHSYKTIRVCAMGQAGAHDLLNNFTVETNSVRRGVVNVNSGDKIMIAPGFMNVPLKYPESYIDSNDPLDRIGTRSVVYDIAKKLVDKGPYTNISQICSFDWSTIPGLGVNNYTELERESILSHSVRLLGVRQNLFAIIVAASPVTTGMGEFARHEREVSALGSKKAIAYVWRDPRPDKNGRHKCFVQFFKWLEN